MRAKPSDLRRHVPPGRRSAFSLVETVGLIGVIGTILALSAGMLNHAYAAHRQALTHLRDMEELQRLSQRLRTDTEDAHVLIGDFGLSIVGEGSPDISYDQLENSIVRRISGDGSARERWILPAGARLTLRFEESTRRGLLAVKIVFDPRENRPPVEWLIPFAHIELKQTESSQAESNNAEPNDAS
ncbi:MAG: hypothetical protein R3C53_00360 [Pirellulaceae bacterium]